MIRVPQVRLVGDNVEVGVYSTQEALKMAQEQQLDLVEISPTADPPVCKIIDYNKFLYEKKKKEKEQKAKSKTSEVKEIRFTPNTDDHDFDFKAKHAEKFLKEGNKVKAYVQFKGRAIQFKERGELLLLKFAERLNDAGVLEGMPNRLPDHHIYVGSKAPWFEITDELPQYDELPVTRTPQPR